MKESLSYPGFITEWWNAPHDAEVSIARARVKPGVTPRWPRLRAGSHDPHPARRSSAHHPLGRVDRVFLAVCTPHFTRAGDEDLAVD